MLSVSFDLPPEKALAYFKKKGLKVSFAWQDMVGKAHDDAFTVAKMMDLDLLKTVRDAVDKAMANGHSITRFVQELTPTLQNAGWWGQKELIDPLTGRPVVAQLGSDHRLKTIFRTNIQNAYAAGEWTAVQENSDVFPYLLYDAVDDSRTRAAHAAMDGKVFRVDSPVIAVWYPPNGWNCRCSVIQLTEDDIINMGLTVSEDLPAELVGTRTWVNPRTGVSRNVPIGIDPGFDRIPGGHSQGLKTLLQEKITTVKWSDTPEAAEWHTRVFGRLKDSDYWASIVRGMPNVSAITNPDRGAFYRSSANFISMPVKPGDADLHNLHVWAHEYGHFLDWGLGGAYGFISNSPEFKAALSADRTALMATISEFDTDKNRAFPTSSSESGLGALINKLDTSKDVKKYLRTRLKKLGLTLEEVQDIFNVHNGKMEFTGPDDNELSNSISVARFIYGLEKKRGQDVLHALGWSKHFMKGTMGSLADLLGAITDNAIGYGHSAEYYARTPDGANNGTEAFANVTTLKASDNTGLIKLARLLAPEFTRMVEGFLDAVRSNQN